MSAVLPDRYSVRPMRPEDGDEVADHVAANDVRLIGFSQYSREGIVNHLRDPLIDLAVDSWMVTAGPDLIGTGTVVLDGGTALVDLSSADPLVAGWMLDRAIERATDHARKTGAEVAIKLGLLREDKQTAALAADRGLFIHTTVQRMTIRYAGPLEPPATPAGVVLRRGAQDEQIRRAAHQVITDSFADQPGSVPRPYDDWVKQRESRSTFHWSKLTVLELEGRPVGVRECDDNYLTTEHCGYIGRLGVVTAARGRGLAKYLLRDAFALDSAAGLSGTILHVDTGNPTPAVAVYESVGMRADIVNDIWRKVIPAVDPALE
ncbi:GNAT family N-acetyltransferase [Kribbella qitaiheensis]|uniref:GNAT family N-acetyltransferase n=1 Tax=Kribbella qitaiheensis TaxID=1544730 RepID=UPI00360B04A0